MLAPGDILLEEIVTHELGHAVCATALGLTVIEVQMPMPYSGDDGRMYGRKGTTKIENIWLNDESKELNPEIVDEIACVAVAGVVAERLSQNQPTTSLEVLRQLQVGRNQDDYRFLRKAICLDEVVSLTAATPHIERAVSLLITQTKAIHRAGPPLIAKISAADDALDISWSEIATLLGEQPEQ